MYNLLIRYRENKNKKIQIDEKVSYVLTRGVKSDKINKSLHESDDKSKRKAFVQRGQSTEGKSPKEKTS